MTVPPATISPNEVREIGSTGIKDHGIGLRGVLDHNDHQIAARYRRDGGVIGRSACLGKPLA
ncbi:MAG TPA: hypothetical protein VLA51_13100, partial [Paracoccaceae bacterium]|nr:hypothetical protein [Paracoccaceae bacterium]